MIGIPVAWAYSHVLEWGLHKYVLHGMGRKRENFWSFHFHDHHRTARTENMHDRIYDGHPFRWDPAGKELFGLGLLTVVHAPMAPLAPFFVGTLAVMGAEYYVKHKRSHQDLDWAREHLPWHYDHHMGPNQDSNWGVRADWVDRLFGTREPYCGTEKEARDLKRRTERLAKRAAERRVAKQAAEAAEAAKQAAEAAELPQPQAMAAK